MERSLQYSTSGISLLVFGLLLSGLLPPPVMFSKVVIVLAALAVAVIAAPSPQAECSKGRRANDAAVGVHDVLYASVLTATLTVLRLVRCPRRHSGEPVCILPPANVLPYAHISCITASTVASAVRRPTSLFVYVPRRSASFCRVFSHLLLTAHLPRLHRVLARDLPQGRLW